MSFQFTHVHSFACRLTPLRNMRAHGFAVSLCYATLTWQRIFKGWLQVTINAFFRMWLLTSSIFARFFFWAISSNHCLAGTRSRGRCWAAIRLSHRPESSGRAVHEEVDGLDIRWQHGRRFVLLRHTHRPQRKPYPICVNRSGNVRHG